MVGRTGDPWGVTGGGDPDVHWTGTTQCRPTLDAPVRWDGWGASEVTPPEPGRWRGAAHLLRTSEVGVARLNLALSSGLALYCPAGNDLRE